MKHGANLPHFHSVQLDFSAHIRNPDVYPRPADIEPRRMQIYLDLFFNNIRNFLDSAFPVSREILGQERWLALIREFVHRHPSESPYFAQISEEFLTFLSSRGLDGLPGFLLELCHYEWVELKLDIAEAGPAEAFERKLDGARRVVLTPVHRLLVYEYPVHLLGPEHTDVTAEHPTFLVVFRRADEQVRFVESNAVTHRLLELAVAEPLDDALKQVCEELREAGRNVDGQVISRQGQLALERLMDQRLVLGSAVAGESGES